MQTFECPTYIGYDNIVIDSERDLKESTINVSINDEREEAFISDLLAAGFYEPSIDVDSSNADEIMSFFNVIRSYEDVPEQVEQEISEAIGFDIQKRDYSPETLQEMCKDVIASDVNTFIDAMDDARVDREDKADITMKYTQKVLDKTLKNNQIER